MGEHPAQPHSAPGPGSVAVTEHRRRRLARFNRTVTNKVLHRPSRWFPQLGSLTHVGRRTHEVYRTPVSVFRTRDGFRIPLTHGRGADWVQNALNHGAVRLTTRRTIYELTDPVIVHDTERKYLPWPWRTFLRFFGVSYFIDFRAATAASGV
jgi:deazaflavin-dependent oxidoreductase (nitroreductase family)